MTKVTMAIHKKAAVPNPQGGDTDDDVIRPGDIVWGLHGRISYLARVCTLAEIPDNLKTQFQNNTSTKFIAWWYGMDCTALSVKLKNLV